MEGGGLSAQTDTWVQSINDHKLQSIIGSRVYFKPLCDNIQLIMSPIWEPVVSAAAAATATQLDSCIDL